MQKGKTGKLYKRGWRRAALFCVVTGILLAGCRKKEVHVEDVVKTSIFSWEEDYIYPEQEEQAAQTMEALGCRAVYQEIPRDVEEEVIREYLKRRSGLGQDVYYLTGAAEWGMEEGAWSMLEQVERVHRLNQKAEKEERFCGIVWDVEPYLLDEWEESSDQIMEQYIKNCKSAYRRASRYGLRVIVCIPNFYDRKGYTSQLAELTEHGCDALAVMNYNKADEAGQIRTEVGLAEKYGKGIIHIAELQKPGYHDLTENNTYYYDGLDAVKESFEELKKEFAYPGLGFSWHYMRPAIELLDKGEQR